MLKAYLKKKGLANRTLLQAWTYIRSNQLLNAYRARREAYARIAQERKLEYSLQGSVGAIRSRIAKRGYTPILKPLGAVHTFVFLPLRGWHSSLLADLHELGPVSHYDYVADGFDVNTLLELNSKAANARALLNDRALEMIRQVHRRQPIDWIFVYASGLEITPGFLKAVTEEIGVPIVNMCLDDKQSWEGERYGGQRAGQIDIAPHFDLSWTSARIACNWYLVEGARPIYLPEGFDQKLYRPRKLQRDLGISFIGNNYGFRPLVVEELRRAGLRVDAFGADWEHQAVFGDAQIDVLNRSCINLRMGGIGYSEELTNVKTRDFEIPGTGGGVYLTSFNSDLAQHFDVGREIVCYRNSDELIELARHLLRHPNEAQEIADRGRARCLREHRWLHRYMTVLEVLGVMHARSSLIAQAAAPRVAPAAMLGNAG